MRRLFAVCLATLVLSHCDGAGFNATNAKQTPAKKPADKASKGDDDDNKGTGPKAPTKSPAKPVTGGNGAREDAPLLVKIGDKLNLCDKAGIKSAAEGSKSADDSKASFDAKSCTVSGVASGPVKVTVNGPDGPKEIFVKVLEPGEGNDDATVAADPVPGTATMLPGDVQPVVENFASDLVCSDKKYRIDAKCVDSVPIYRWFNGTNGDHFYTPSAGPGCQGKVSSAAECGGETVNEGGWHFEGIGFWALPLDQPPHPKLQKFYRLFAGALGDHFYTISEPEMQASTQHGYTLEGFYQVFPTQQPFTKPIHRWYNSASGDHFYTFAAGPGCEGKNAAAAECGGETVNEGGWHYEGIAGFLFPG